MSTVNSPWHTQGSPFNLGENDTKNIITNVSPEILDGQIESLIKKSIRKVSTLCSLDGGSSYSTIGADFSNTITNRGQGDGATKELLSDCHKSFPIFHKSLDQAIDIARSGGDISVELQKSDINNNKFLSLLKNIKDAGVSTLRITLEIFSKKNELYDEHTLRQLKGATELGFRFGMYDFMENEEGDIQTDNLINVIKKRMLPRYIKITRTALEKIKTGVNKGIVSLYNNLVNTGTKIIEIMPEKVNQEIKTKHIKEAKGIIENASIEGEWIYRIDGVKYGSELLIRFSNGLTIIDGLNQLKLSDTTGLLMQKNIEKAAIIIKNIGTRTFLNIYVKDLGQPGFREVISSILREIHKNDRKKIIFEILEDRYGYLDDLVIANIRFLQESGYSIAVDDLSIDDGNPGMSLENLETLHAKKIFPEYIKIDGKHIEDIRNGSFPESKIKHLREVIGVFSVLQNPPIFIAEWIQDTEHALLIRNTLATSKAEFLYQGRNIQNGKFGLK
ncbi:hypothetical protein K2X92_03620 [Candidatus Gracilibacteria bacterium]|nr:hypothetical protein [Candidatus Gracilibacteria bacterium]